MKEQILSELGLAPNETKIYLVLLEKGDCTASQVAEASGIHRVNVYDSINKLKDKGLASEIIKSGKKFFQAAPPHLLKNILKEKEIKLNRIMPELLLASQLNKSQIPVQIFEGYDFLRNIFLHFIEIKQEIYAQDAPKFIIDKVGKYFQEVIHKRRAQQKQWMYHIYSKEAIDRINFLNALPYTEARYLNQKDHNVMTLICGDEVCICLVNEEGDQKPTFIMINNSRVAEVYRNHFKLMWQKAIKP